MALREDYAVCSAPRNRKMRLRAVDLKAFCATTGKKQKCKFPFSFSTISAQETGVFSTLHFSRASQMLFQQSLQEVLLGAALWWKWGKRPAPVKLEGTDAPKGNPSWSSKNFYFTGCLLQNHHNRSMFLLPQFATSSVIPKITYSCLKPSYLKLEAP